MKGQRLVKPYSATLGLAHLDRNNNKFYILRVVRDKKGHALFTRWGRMGVQGSEQLRRARSREHAVALFRAKYRQKTGTAWGSGSPPVAGKYWPVQTQARGAASGPKPAPEGSAFPEPPGEVAALVRRIFRETKRWLRSRMRLAFDGTQLATPLGPLGEEQLRRGGEALRLLREAVPPQFVRTEVAPGSLRKGDEEVDGKVVRWERAPPPTDAQVRELRRLSSLYYTLVPHRAGFKKLPVLDTREKIWRELDLVRQLHDLQMLLRRDAQVLRTRDVARQYASLETAIAPVPPAGAAFARLRQQVRPLRLLRAFALRRPGEAGRPRLPSGRKVPGRRLFHGSRMHNWIGILSRGLLMPAQVEAGGVQLTDSGWLGRGIYFGDHRTAAMYAGTGDAPKSKKAPATALVLACRVAMGRVEKRTEIDSGITRPSPGHDSCHGVPGKGSDFQQDEFVVYTAAQQRMEYLLEVAPPAGGSLGKYASSH